MGIALILSAGGAAKGATINEPVGRLVDRTHLWNRCGVDLIGGFRNMYNLHVIYAPEEEYPYRGWFFGWAVEDGNPGYPGCDAIFAARSKELLSGWQVWAGENGWDAALQARLWVPVIVPQNEYFDELHNGDPSVVKLGDHYYMAYSSVGHDRDRKPFGDDLDGDGSYLCIMGAVSTDGVSWVRSARPILAYEHEYGASLPYGDSVLYGSYHRPTLMWEGGRWRMWFDYWAGRTRGVSMGYAENEGNFLNPEDWKLVRGGDNPCIPQFPNPDVVRVGDLLYAYGDPPVSAEHEWRSRKITEAVSLDGQNWLLLGYVEPEEGWPATHVPEAFVQPLGEGRWRIYVTYGCQRGGEPYDYRYDSIRCMWRDVDEDEIALLRAMLSAPGGQP